MEFGRRAGKFSLICSQKTAMMRSINPFTGALIAEYPVMGREEVISKIESVERTFSIWAKKNVDERAAGLQAFSMVLEKNKEAYARLISLEMGKPIRESRLEIAKCVWLCRHYAEKGAEYLADKTIITDAQLSKIKYEPLGVLFAIMPWNFPFWQVLRFVVPAIMAGNAVVLKHAPNVTGCGLAIAEAIVEAGLPDNLIGLLVMDIDQTENVIAHPAIRGVTITGSEKAGRSVAALAGKHLKKIVLELGGSDPFIVFPDAEFGNACTTGMMSRMLNAGQVCIAAKRFLIHEDIYESFVNQQIKLLSALHPGNPLDENTTVGPIARPDLLEQIQQQLDKTLSSGARLRYGGKVFDKHPSIFMPTIVEDVRPGMVLWDEESFGPVMCLTSFSTAEEAIQLANQSVYGLGASVWTTDNKLAAHLASQLQCGSVFVNSLVKSDPRIPFGGTKNSGFGRELGEAGIKEFVNIKTYWFQ